MSRLARIEMSHGRPVQFLDPRHSDGNTGGNYHHVECARSIGSRRFKQWSTAVYGALVVKWKSSWRVLSR